MRIKEVAIDNLGEPLISLISTVRQETIIQTISNLSNLYIEPSNYNYYQAVLRVV